MKDLNDYIKDRDAAMLSYPDTRKLEDLVKNYPEFFSPAFKRMWSNAKAYVKLRTLEIMVGKWDGAPAWLKSKVADAERARRGKK